MKRISQALFVLALMMLSLSACKKPTEDLTVIFNTSSLFKSPLMVRFDDASAIAEFDVSITGKDSALVQMGSGSKVFKAVNGLLPLALKAQAKPTAANPLMFVINAEIPGYTTVKKTIIVYNDSSSIFTIPITRFVKPVDGTAELTIETLLSAGKTTKVESFSTATNPKLAEKVTISIPANDQMQNYTRNPINADILTTKVTLYGTSLTSLNAGFPGHQRTVNAMSIDGKRILWGLDFVSAGLLKINTTAGNTTVSNFEKPIDIVQELPVNFINPKTGSLLRVGETIPLWIFDSSGAFKETIYSATVVSQNGRLAAKYAIPNPGTWNLAWTSSPNISFVNKNLNINLLPTDLPFTGTYNLLFQNGNGVVLAELVGYQPARDNFRNGALVNGEIVYTNTPGKFGYGLPRVPNVNSAKILVYNQSGRKMGEAATFNPTTTTNVDISIDNKPVVVVPTPPIEYLNISVELSGKCTNKSIISPLNSWVTINNTTNKTNSFFYVKNGKIDNATASIRVILGHQYTISITYDGVTQTSSAFKAEKSDTVIQLSSVFEGKTNYISGTNTLNIAGTLSQECK
ncbi:MAG: hypothetical protein EOO90_21280 [Pedobacter sp.]|nr:MAG: hypothetical protein EOO90_21280 [Pedobacter sp.]